jgi:hypothetical protein
MGDPATTARDFPFDWRRGRTGGDGGGDGEGAGSSIETVICQYAGSGISGGIRTHHPPLLEQREGAAAATKEALAEPPEDKSIYLQL